VGNKIKYFGKVFSLMMDSQNADLSQLTCSQFSATQSQANQHDERQEESNMPQTMETEVEMLSVRAASLCEQNQQIRNYVETNLMQLEKKRIKLINRNKEIDNKTKALKETYDHHVQQSVDLQMSIEEWSGKYQAELDQRNQVVETLNNTNVLVEAFQNYWSEGMTAYSELEKTIQSFATEFERQYNKNKEIQEKGEAMRLKYIASMEEKINRMENIRSTIMKRRESSLSEISVLVAQNLEKSNRIRTLQEDLKRKLNERGQVNAAYDEMTIQNKVLTETIAKLQQEYDEETKASTARIQHLELQIYSEQHKNSNLEIKNEEKEHLLNGLLVKNNELTNLLSQVTQAVDETERATERITRQTDECKDQLAALNHQIDSISERIREEENVEIENQMLKNKICSYQKDIEQSVDILKEKEVLQEQIIYQIDERKKSLLILNEEVSVLECKLKEAKNVRDELNTKITLDQVEQAGERESKSSRNIELEKANKETSLKVNRMKTDISALQETHDSLKTQEQELRQFINKYRSNAEQSRQKLCEKKKESEVNIQKLNGEIARKEVEEASYMDLICDLKPKQDELPDLKAQEAAEMAEVCKMDKEFELKKQTLEHEFNSTLLDLGKETEKMGSIMKGLIAEQEAIIEKTKENIKIAEKTRLQHENDVKALQQQLSKLKSYEASERAKVVKLEKRLRAINREIKVTKQDLIEATSNKSHNQATSKWVQAVPFDDYEFSEI